MSCELSDQGRAFSTILTAFIGSIVNGITNGALVAFITGWISWFAVLRILIGALYGLYQAFSPKYTHLSTTDDEMTALQQPGLETDTTAEGAVPVESAPGGKAAMFSANSKRNMDISVFGWIGWVYAAIYSPITQILWLAANWEDASPPLKLVRALCISVGALGLTIDTKKRYAERLGGIAGVMFKLINGGSAFAMGAMCLALLIKGAIDQDLGWYFILNYCVFCVIWTAASFRITPVDDGSIKGFGFIPNVLMGAYAGVFLAGPAFAVMKTAEFPTLNRSGFDTPESGSTSLHEYLLCESVPVWQKMAAILP